MIIFWLIDIEIQAKISRVLSILNFITIVILVSLICRCFYLPSVSYFCHLWCFYSTSFQILHFSLFFWSSFSVLIIFCKKKDRWYIPFFHQQGKCYDSCYALDHTQHSSSFSFSFLCTFRLAVIGSCFFFFLLFRFFWTLKRKERLWQVIREITSSRISIHTLNSFS